MFYFAYGSNLSLRRLKKRAPSAVLQGTFRLHQFELLFHKIGRDGSGKCDAFFTGQNHDVVYGRVFEITKADKKSLDQCEGLGRGYDLRNVTVQNETGQTHTAFTYVATSIESELAPFCWYRQHVLIGASEAKFPESYIEQRLTVFCRRDPEEPRREREISLYL
ncbi:MAG: gamma-glutamylcyclotransferase family protein [Myxococcota bacterium]|nr:gamma-glutamylcyclotransferase family protein [Myxococcota bacterium]